MYHNLYRKFSNVIAVGKRNSLLCGSANQRQAQVVYRNNGLRGAWMLSVGIADVFVSDGNFGYKALLK